ncbi:MAG: hypothetical protein ACHQT9_02620 [Candidatus Saccharimonadales bacterium]
MEENKNIQPAQTGQSINQPAPPQVVTPSVQPLAPNPTPAPAPPMPQGSANTLQTPAFQPPQSVNQSVPTSPTGGPPQPFSPDSTPFVSQTTQVPGASTGGGSGKKKLLKIVAVALLAIIVIAGGSAGAYYGYILPNKPENILAKSIVNTVEQNKLSYKSTVNINVIDSSATAATIKLNLDGSFDAVAKAADATLTTEASGLSVSVQGRIVNQSLYVRFGDLTQVAKYVSSLYPQYATAANLAAKTLSNQWLSIDKTLLASANLSCITDPSITLSKSDEQTIQNAYMKNTFFKVNSDTVDNVNGQNADKYMTTIDNNKAAAFINQLEGSDIGKSTKSCGSSSSSSNSSPSPVKGDGKTEDIIFWVDKSNKRIVQVYFKPAAQTISGTKTSGDLNVSFGYTVPPIQVPKGALPAEQVINQLEPAFSAPPSSSPSPLGKLITPIKPAKPANLNAAAQILRSAL